jgi:hypothetical protein
LDDGNIVKSPYGNWVPYKAFEGLVNEVSCYYKDIGNAPERAFRERVAKQIKKYSTAIRRYFPGVYESTGYGGSAALYENEKGPAVKYEDHKRIVEEIINYYEGNREIMG